MAEEQATSTQDSTPDVPTRTDVDHPASAEMWLSRIKKCKSIRYQLVQDWATNIDYRRGKQFTTDDDQDRRCPPSLRSP
jgi:hypothetical protein